MPVGTTYYDQYISKAKQAGLSIPNALENGLKNVQELFNGISNPQWTYRYAPEKWSIKELVQHVMDSERIFCFRALSIARGEEQSLPGYEQDVYVHNSFADYREPNAIKEEYQVIRKSSIALFNSFSDAILQKTGTANGVGFTVEELGYILVGHELHHLDILQQRYL